MILSKYVEDHIKHVEKILINLAESSVMDRIANCHLFQREVEWLRDMVNTGRLETYKTNVKSLRQARTPTS